MSDTNSSEPVNLTPVNVTPVNLSVEGDRAAGLSRREAMQWVLAAVAASALPGRGRPAFGAESGAKVLHEVTDAKGYGRDPNLVQNHVPGSLWPLTFNDAQRKTATALADTILPKDQYGPAASEVGVIPMLDEWVSAPYAEQQADRPVILDGLAWIEAESAKRFGGKAFANLDENQKHAICDDICFTGNTKPGLGKQAYFFSRFRSLCAGAYYATPAGWKAIGYVGNVPLGRFDGPPQEVLDKLGVTQTVA